MPTFEDAAGTTAAPEEVWKLLYDPSRFPEWWAGVGAVEEPAGGAPGDFTLFPAGYPDFPMPQELRADRNGGRVIVSCLVSDLEFEWRLTPEAGGTRIDVHVTLPEREAHRLDAQRDAIARSLRNLAALASAGVRKYVRSPVVAGAG
jgi:uncharacterized protein YndB with AHSA1/START domain